jgi:hypothetical protein
MATGQNIGPPTARMPRAGRLRVVAVLGVVTVVSAGCAAVGSLVQDAGPQQTRTRPVGVVSAVDLASSGELVLSGGEPPSLRISAGRNVIRHLTSDVQGGRLTLGTDGSMRPVGRVRYDLVLPAARVVELSGSGTVHVTAPSALERVLLPGSGDVRVDGLRTQGLTVDLSGSGQVTAAGSATRQRISIGGSGHYAGDGLASQDVEVTISGSGSADVTAGRTLTASISGSGTVTYAGTATVSSSVTGSGRVVRR